MRLEAQSNPGVLKWARRMAGFELAEAAQKAGVKPERLSKWERGELRPTVTQLRKLADIYKRPLAVFFLEKVPTDDKFPRDFRRLDPGEAISLSPQLRIAIREALERRQAARELLNEIDERPISFRLSASLKDDPEEVGERVRDELLEGRRIPSDDPRLAFNFWRSCAERLGVLVFQAENIQVKEMRGFSIAEHPLPAVVLNIKDAPVARSFSLMHELAHIMLGRSGLCILEEHGPPSVYQQIEVFCNHVAGAALVPADSLMQEPELSPQRATQIRDSVIVGLAKRYAISPETILRRLLILNRVTREFYQRKHREYKRENERHRSKPRKGGFAPPHTIAVATSGKLFTRLVLQAYDDTRITASDVAGFLRVRLKHLERIRHAVQLDNAVGDSI
jgi:Zn-dependent peptidase ImmA (M78 family)/DNA-binding XRE family transcriptional regulator